MALVTEAISVWIERLKSSKPNEKRNGIGNRPREFPSGFIAFPTGSPFLLPGVQSPSSLFRRRLVGRGLQVDVRLTFSLRDGRPRGDGAHGAAARVGDKGSHQSGRVRHPSCRIDGLDGLVWTGPGRDTVNPLGDPSSSCPIPLPPSLGLWIPTDFLVVRKPQQICPIRTNLPFAPKDWHGRLTSGQSVIPLWGRVPALGHCQHDGAEKKRKGRDCFGERREAPSPEARKGFERDSTELTPACGRSPSGLAQRRRCSCSRS